MENSTPIDISSRHTSMSPPGQQASNLTSALQRAATGDRAELPAHWNGSTSAALKATAARKDSFGATMAQYSNGSKPITVTGSNRDKPRRESLAGSLVGGMSWGGISVGSWIRDDIIMAGTSPFTFQSPSYHSSSYLPKLEANFMRDFSCCGFTLPSLHDLLQHYEEAHAQRSPQPTQSRTQQSMQPPSVDTRTGIPLHSIPQNQQQSIASGASRAVSSQPGTPRPTNRLPLQTQQTPMMQNPSAFTQSQPNDLPDLDAVEDMEMDDPLSDFQTQPQNLMQARFSQENSGSRVTPLNMGMLQGQQLFRSSAPGTPVSPRPLQNNPTVSSVNTPTLMPLPLQQGSQFRSTPDSSAPGTPAELDDSIVGPFGDMSMQGNLIPGSQAQFSAYGGNDMLDLCIDEPAKRLFRPTGPYNSKSQPNAQFRLGTSHYSANSDIAQHIRDQQKLAGVPDTALGMKPEDEPKPFRCPVIGCEKAYKNQNGLKYHKSHGHNNQQLHDNADGTYSIVDPETSAPYPGTLGMEKEKPYRCEVCGKRYKNLNGLKYHRAHSPPCNPEFSFAAQAGRGFNTPGGVMHGENINIAGAGLPGIGEERL
ncbi:Transcriptional regulator of ribosomal biogenesis protein [Myotisia sp. PD_48]|nr:Transcriptional regulator of ribosomal biogenesis protein [Myotisia sp. PD_48]